MAYIAIQEQFEGKPYLWTDSTQDDSVMKMVAEIDERRANIINSLQEMYGVDLSLQRFVDFVSMPCAGKAAEFCLKGFKGRPKFSKDCQVRSKRGSFLPPEDESSCIATLICILTELYPGLNTVDSWSAGSKIIQVYGRTKAASILRNWRHNMHTVGTQLRRWMPFVKVLAKVSLLFKNPEGKNFSHDSTHEKLY